MRGVGVFEGFCAFVSRSTFLLGLAGEVGWCPVRDVGFCGCLTDRPCCGVGLFRPRLGFCFILPTCLSQILAEA